MASSTKRRCEQWNRQSAKWRKDNPEKYKLVRENEKAKRQAASDARHTAWRIQQLSHALTLRHHDRHAAWSIVKHVRQRERIRAWMKRNPGYQKGRCRKRELEQLRAKRYGCTASQISRLRTIQNSRCAICGIHFGLGKHRECVDHCHATGRVRGLLCQNCNFGIGNFQDNPQYLENAKTYLVGSNTNEAPMADCVASPVDGRL